MMVAVAHRKWTFGDIFEIILFIRRLCSHTTDDDIKGMICLFQRELIVKCTFDFDWRPVLTASLAFGFSSNFFEN